MVTIMTTCRRHADPNMRGSSPTLVALCAMLIAFACFTLASLASAQSLTFPELTGRVVDNAGILDTATRQQLEKLSADLEAKTTDQLVVVTLPSLQGTSIEDYGYQLGRKWQIGQKDKNNGAILIVAPNERRVRIEVGYGLEPTLPTPFPVSSSRAPSCRASGRVTSPAACGAGQRISCRC